MPGTEPGAPPRYTMPGPAYSPAEAAEERFRAKIRAEKEAEQSAGPDTCSAEKRAKEPDTDDTPPPKPAVPRR